MTFLLPYHLQIIIDHAHFIYKDTPTSVHNSTAPGTQKGDR